MIRISLISLLLLCCHLVSGQKGQLNFDKGMEYYNKKQCSPAFNAFNEALNFFIIEKADKSVVGMAYYWMGMTLNDLPDCKLFYKAMDYFTHAAGKGYAPAYTALGVAYANGIQEGKTGPKDENKALLYFQKAAELGDAAGQYHLANYYLNGTAIKKDEAKALDLLIQAVIGGNLDAIIELKQLDRQKVKDKLQKSAKKKMTDIEQLQMARSFHILEDYQQAFTWFQKSAEQDNRIAQSFIGHYYESGSYGIPVDLQKAYGWYLKSAENGHAPSQIHLGEMYAEGKGVPKDPKKALEWYEKAANNGNSRAQDWIADYYYSQENYRQAAEWYLKAAENGSSVSQNRLAVMYYEGKGVPKDLKKAFEWFLKSAEQNWHWGQYNAALRYEYGEGTEKNMDKAAEWYLKAAENSNVSAQCRMGELCEDKKQYTQAKEWYLKSAEQGDMKAQNQLGLLYFYIEKDEGKAFEWTMRSATQNNGVAQSNIGYFYEHGVGVAKDMDKAYEWNLKAANNHQSDAQNWLGLYYSSGDAKDVRKAFEWFTKSAGQNNRNAQYNLAGCYERGEGVAKDETTAKEWYRKALANGHQGAGEALDRIVAAQLQLTVNGSSADGTGIDIKKSDRGRTKPAALADWNKPVIPPINNIVKTKNTKTVYVSRNRVAYGSEILTGTFNNGMLPIYHGAKKRWGVLDTDGNLVLDYIYDSKPEFSEGVCILRVFNEGIYDHKTIHDYQVMDIKGYVLATVSTSDLSRFSGGVAMGFKVDGPYFGPKNFTSVYYNKLGQELSSYPVTTRQNDTAAPWERETIRELQEGLRAYYDLGKKRWGFLDENGKIIIPARYLNVGDFSDGLALVQITKDNESYWGYIDRWGNIVIEAKFSNRPLPFSHGYAVVTKRDKTKCVIDKKGNIVLDNVRDMTQFYKGYAFLLTEDAYYLVDTNFKKLKKVKYFPDYIDETDGAVMYIDDLTLAKRVFNGDCGIIIDYMGNVILDYGNVSIFRDGRAWCNVTLINDRTEYVAGPGSSGYINTKGEFVFVFTEPEF